MHLEAYVITPAIGDDRTDSSSQLQGSKAILPPNVHVKRVSVRLPSRLKTIDFMVACRLGISELVKDFGIDLIHSQSDLSSYLIPRSRLRIPELTTIHTTVQGHIEALRTCGVGFEQMTAGEKMRLVLAPLLVPLENRFYTDDRYYLTVSNWAKQRFHVEKGISLSRIKVTHVGVDSEVFSPEKKKEALDRLPIIADADAPIVLYLSRMATRKGIHHLLKAAQGILKKADAFFVFAGSGPRPPINLPPDSYVFLGHVSEELPPYLYAASDVFVLPSLYENFPSCVLEAMASECAVVASEICGIPEMIRHELNGLMIPPSDVGALTTSILRLIQDDGLRKRLGHEARRTTLKEFTWEGTTKATVDYYEEVLQNYTKGGR